MLGTLRNSFLVRGNSDVCKGPGVEDRGVVKSMMGKRDGMGLEPNHMDSRDMQRF